MQALRRRHFDKIFDSLQVSGGSKLKNVPKETNRFWPAETLRSGYDSCKSYRVGGRIRPFRALMDLPALTLLDPDFQNQRDSRRGLWHSKWRVCTGATTRENRKGYQIPTPFHLDHRERQNNDVEYGWTEASPTSL
jgi:hypothetical protein